MAGGFPVSEFSATNGLENARAKGLAGCDVPEEIPTQNVFINNLFINIGKYLCRQ